jgi:hypothetical protein
MRSPWGPPAARHRRPSDGAPCAPTVLLPALQGRATQAAIVHPGAGRTDIQADDAPARRAGSRAAFWAALRQLLQGSAER